MALVVLNRPPENLLDRAHLIELDELLMGISDDLSVSVVVLTGGLSGYFVGHGDLGDKAEMAANEPSDSSALVSSARASQVWERLSSIDQPVIAAVNGQAWGGGCELALAAQMRVASTEAHFAMVEVADGAIPGAGGTQRLPRLIGASQAARMVLSCEVVTAAEALRIGLVDTVLPADGFVNHALEWVAPIARLPRHSLTAAKRALVDGLRMPLTEGIAYEQRMFGSAITSPATKAIFDGARSPGADGKPVGLPSEHIRPPVTKATALRTTDERVAWLVDRAEISDLLHGFARALDDKDWEAYAANFAEDGELVVPWGGHKGRSGMAAYVGNDLAKFSATHHLSANHQVTVKGDTATSRSYLQAVHIVAGDDQSTHFDVGGWYDNEYRRTDEGWRFTRVTITDVWKTGAGGPA